MSECECDCGSITRLPPDKQRDPLFLAMLHVARYDLARYVAQYIARHVARYVAFNLPPLIDNGCLGQSRAPGGAVCKA